MDLGKAGGEVRKEKQKKEGKREREKGGEQEARVKSKSQHESSWTSVVSVEARLPLRCLYEFDEEPVSLERAASRTSIQSEFT